MTTQTTITLLETGIPNLDAILGGGLPNGSVSVLAGPPGSGKTILAQQIGFFRAAAGGKVIFFHTLSEPMVKTLLYLQQFNYFDETRLLNDVRFIDLGSTLKTKGLDAASAAILEHIKRERPTMIVIDSFRAFDDMTSSPEELRKFSYQLAVNLIAWECTTLLLGEFGPEDIQSNPIFSVIDSLIVMNQEEASGEQQRFVRIVKMRGTAHNRDKHPFAISSDGIAVYAPRVTLRRDAQVETHTPERLKTGIASLDPVLGAGISRGSSVLVAGDSGTGKTILLLEFIYRGAKDFGHKGIFISFEETEERIRATARGLGWDLDREIEKGLVELLFIPQPDVLVEGHLLMIDERIRSRGITRVAIDSLSGFLHKVRSTQLTREKVFQLATIVQNANAVGFFATDRPQGSKELSRFRIESTIVDGVILLNAQEEGVQRRRYLEVYKLRNTAHQLGKHAMSIGKDGIKIMAITDG